MDPSTALFSMVSAVLPLVLLAALAARIGAGADRPWKLAQELGLALGAGLVGTVMCQGLLGALAQGGNGAASSDFLQICEAIELSRRGDLGHWTVQRSMVVAAPAILLAEAFGLVDALVASSTLGQLALLSGLHLWASALGGRLAGGAAVLLACAIAPLAALGHFATFYPPMLAAFVWAAAGSVVALKDPKPPSFLLGGLSLGLTLAAAPRGLIFGLPAALLLGIAVGGVPRWRDRAVAMVLVFGCLVASWCLARATGSPAGMGLDEHLANYVQDALRFAGRSPDAALTALFHDINDNKLGFVWGWRGLSSIPLTLERMVALQMGSARVLGAIAPPSADWVGLIGPWLGVAAAGAGLSLASLGRSRLLVGLALSAAPFLLSLWGSLGLVSHTRYLANGAPVLALLGGLGLALAARGLGPALRPVGRKERQRQGSPARADLLVLLLLALAVVGLLPSGLSPRASWRTRMVVDSEPAASLLYAASDAPLEGIGDARALTCIEGLRADFARGLPVGSRLLGWTASARDLGEQPAPWPGH